MSLSLKRNKNRMRPSKGPAERRRRLKGQRARLARLGVPASLLENMQADEIRALLRHPKKTAKRFQAVVASAS